MIKYHLCRINCENCTSFMIHHLTPKMFLFFCQLGPGPGTGKGWWGRDGKWIFPPGSEWSVNQNALRWLHLHTSVKLRATLLKYFPNTWILQNIVRTNPDLDTINWKSNLFWLFSRFLFKGNLYAEPLPKPISYIGKRYGYSYQFKLLMSLILSRDLLVYPLGELGVHHEVVNMFLCSGQLQLPGHHRHQQRRAPSTLQI